MARRPSRFIAGRLDHPLARHAPSLAGRRRRVISSRGVFSALARRALIPERSETPNSAIRGSGEHRPRSLSTGSSEIIDTWFHGVFEDVTLLTCRVTSKLTEVRSTTAAELGVWSPSPPGVHLRPLLVHETARLGPRPFCSDGASLGPPDDPSAPPASRLGGRGRRHPWHDGDIEQIAPGARRRVTSAPPWPETSRGVRPDHNRPFATRGFSSGSSGPVVKDRAGAHKVPNQAEGVPPVGDHGRKAQRHRHGRRHRRPSAMTRRAPD